MLRMVPDVGRNKPASAGVSGEEKRDALAGNARKRAYSGLRCVTSVTISSPIGMSNFGFGHDPASLAGEWHPGNLTVKAGRTMAKA
jgi:hypothetical protein